MKGNIAPLVFWGSMNRRYDLGSVWLSLCAHLFVSVCPSETIPTHLLKERKFQKRYSKLSHVPSSLLPIWWISQDHSFALTEYVSFLLFSSCVAVTLRSCPNSSYNNGSLAGPPFLLIFCHSCWKHFSTQVQTINSWNFEGHIVSPQQANSVLGVQKLL